MKKYIKLILLFILMLLILSCAGMYISRTNKIAEYRDLTINEEVIVFEEPKDLIKIEIDTLGKKLPKNKESGELPVVLKISEGNTLVEAYGSIKVQGSSTARWPKKNWSIKIFRNEDRKEEIKIKIGDSVASSKWVAKAEWIDPTMLRNPLSFKLWEEIVKTREELPIYEVENAIIGNDFSKEKRITNAQGFPNLYTSKVKVNDEFYGLSNLTLGHDLNNFNIDEENPEHIYMEFDARFGYTPVKDWAKFKSSGIGQWIDGYHPENKKFTNKQKESIDNLSKIINGDLDNFKANFDKYLDKRNMIDMLLFMEAIYDWDAVAQDIEMVTYNLEKWYMLPWDKDTTFGLDYNGSGLISDSTSKTLIDYDKENPEQKPWYKTYMSFTKEVEKRYAELRDGDVFTVENLDKLAEEIISEISNKDWKNERNRWKKDKRPSVDETDKEQILSWFEERLETLDNQFNYR